DPGLARVKRYSPRLKLDRLHVEPVSQASADQRKGRCGRIAPGTCYRIYPEADFESRAPYTDPEIRRAALAGVILRMLSLGLGGEGGRDGRRRRGEKGRTTRGNANLVEDFPFIDPPDPRAIADGWQQLSELGAVDDGRRLTPVGRTMARLPVDVKLARMLVAAQAHGCLREMLVIASFLGIQDPRERPADQRAAADAAHARFRDPKSEFVGILRLWDAYRAAHEDMTQSQLRKWCDRNFLGFLRMREWRELHRQLKLQCGELGWREEEAAVTGSVVGAVGGSAKPSLPRGRNRREAHGASGGTTQAGRGGARSTAAGSGNRPREALGSRVRGNDAYRQAAVPAADPRGDPHAYVRLHRALIAGLPTQLGHRTERGQYE